MIRRRLPMRLSLAPDVHRALRAMPGDASRFVDAAVRALLAEATTAAAPDVYRGSPDPFACDLCAARTSHSAAQHAEACSRAEADAHAWAEAESRKEAAPIGKPKNVKIRRERPCDSCHTELAPGDVATVTTFRTPRGIERHYRCAYGCRGANALEERAYAMRDHVGGHP